MFTRLNHLNITVSYAAVLKLASAISKLNEVPLRQWIESKAAIKFIGDDVDVLEGVRDTRSNHLKHLCHMYSVLVAKSRLPPVVATAKPRSLRSLHTTCFEPTSAHIASIKLNLSIIFCTILCTYIKDFQKLKRLVPQHIYHKYSLKMSERSEVVVLDVLYKNEACHQDMLDIMKYQQKYLGKDFSGCVPSGGDLLTCERQRCAQRHVMDSDTKEERLELLEPIIEDWHTLMCFFRYNYMHVHCT